MKKIDLLIIVALLGSCSKFLEPKSNSEFIPKNVVSLNEMLTTGGYFAQVSNGFGFLEPFSDDLEMTTENAYFQGSGLGDEKKYQHLVAMTKKIQDGEFNFPPKTPWEQFYKNILYCNAAIDYLPTVKGESDYKDYVKAQALFLRALSYFYLVNYYGQPYNYNKEALGVPIKLTSDLITKMVPRNTVEEVYDQMLNDLHESEKLWENTPEQQYRQDYRTNLPATQFLLSKVYLFMENWSEAKRYAEMVMGWKQFSLYDLNTFQPSGTQPSLNYSTYSIPETIWLYGLGTQTVHGVLNLILFKEAPNDKNYNRKGFIASSSLLALYGEDDSDLRKDLYMFREWVTDKTPGFYISTRKPVGKIAHNPNMIPSSESGLTHLKFRLSEIYLIYAECCAMIDGKESEAIRVLNELRRNRMKQSAYKPMENLSGSALLDFVKEERRRELCFEGSRWFDMRRWGMKSYNREWRKYGKVEAVYTIQENDNAFTMPIPKSALELNTALIQNPLSTRKID